MRKYVRQVTKKERWAWFFLFVKKDWKMLKIARIEYYHVLTYLDWSISKMPTITLIEKIFRQITYLVISLVNMLLSRNFCQKSVRVNFCFYHTVQWISRFFTLWEIYILSITHSLFGKNFVKATILKIKLLISELTHVIFCHWDTLW